VQRLALVDAAAWWLSEPNGGEEFAYALLTASCAAEITTEHVYLTLITAFDESDEDSEASSFVAAASNPIAQRADLNAVRRERVANRYRRPTLDVLTLVAPSRWWPWSGVNRRPFDFTNSR
jgi:hypothetical protein